MNRRYIETNKQNQTGQRHRELRGQTLSLENIDPEKIKQLLASPIYSEEVWELSRISQPAPYIFFFTPIGEVEKAKSILTDSRYDLRNRSGLAAGYLAPGDRDNTFKELEAGLEDQDNSLLTNLIVGELFDSIRVILALTRCLYC